ncbi:hypothetical protein BTHERMOSOX_1289 [Bathymodiolus thermophilus thioautotrophic gill symbiont]|nr:hypothetical protein BTHERMOSOX_1289 [Bathymodiolus thermophilus thioautotrophic gill symbiont]
MNFNISVLCNTCESQTNCRLGMSNREIQPLRFRCKCGVPIDITMTLDFENTNVDIQVSGAKRIEMDAFEAGVNFVDLHLDFPVSFGKYVMGSTPFMQASMRVGYEAMQIHKMRVNHLNDVCSSEKEIRDILTLYSNNNSGIFKVKVLKFLGSKMACDTQLDQNRALYHAIERSFFPFAEPKRNMDAVNLFTEKLMKLEINNKNALHAFFEEIVTNGFLKNVQTDCLEIYPRIIDIELMLRPALFLDFDHEYEGNQVPYRVSAHEFVDAKDLYKDISEIINRALVLVAGLNNIKKRGSHDLFPEGKHVPSSLNKFADCPFGKKLDYIDESWYSIDSEAIDNQLRNSVAHYKTKYNEVSQEIIYFPQQEGMKQEHPKNMYFLDFSRRILLSFRELHRLNHLTKCLFVYYYLRVLGEEGTPVDI